MIHWSTFVVNFIVPRSWQKLWQPLPLYVVSHYTVFIYIYVSTIDVNHSYLKIDNCDNWHFWIADDESNHSASGEKKRMKRPKRKSIRKKWKMGIAKRMTTRTKSMRGKNFVSFFVFNFLLIFAEFGKDEDGNLPVEELKRKIKRLSRQSAQMLTQLAFSDLQLRAHGRI